jgi:hypothetical protein
VTVHTPKRNKGWKAEGTATWQRAERARRALIAYIEGQEASDCAGCQGAGQILVPTPQGINEVRVWLLPVVCPHCRPEDFER